MKDVKLVFYSEDGQIREFNYLNTEWRKHPLIAINHMLRYPKEAFRLLLHTQGGHFTRDKNTANTTSTILGFAPVRMDITYGGRRHIFKLSSFVSGTIIGVIVYNQYCISSATVKGKVGIDVGANIGAFSIMAAKMGAKKIYAFEPLKEAYELLKENIKLNKLEHIVIPYNYAISDETKKEGTIYYRFDADTGASLHPKFAPGKKRKQKVKMFRLDDIIEEHIDFVKVDAEGSERAILLGAQRLLAKHTPLLMLSAYHWKKDRAELPKIIHKECKDYECKFIKGLVEDIFVCQANGGMRKTSTYGH